MGNWVNYKPKFKKECLLLTATFYREELECKAWLIKKVEGFDGWYWGWLTIEGEEYGDIDDLSADLYKTVNIPKKK